jgi:hypothetical protein
MQLLAISGRESITLVIVFAMMYKIELLHFSELRNDAFLR